MWSVWCFPPLLLEWCDRQPERRSRGVRGVVIQACNLDLVVVMKHEDPMWSKQIVHNKDISISYILSRCVTAEIQC